MRKSDNAILNFILWRISDLGHYLGSWKCKFKTEKRYKDNPPARAHTIPGELIVSLTSYPARYRFAELTLKSLLTQTVKPDRVILWIAEKDMHALPSSILAMRERGLDIMPCPIDLGSYKKLIPALEAFPDAYIVTADDDIYYAPDWLGGFVDAWDGTGINVVANWGSYLYLDENGEPVSTTKWSEDPAQLPEGVKTYFMPWGGTGVLYPPRCFHPDVTNAEKFMALSPRGDDYWFYWMTLLKGVRYTFVNPRSRHFDWPGSQTSGLWMVPNLSVANDTRVSNLVGAYGFPV